MSKFRKGDKVQCIIAASGNTKTKNAIGIVILDNYQNNAGHDCLVEFDKNMDGHCGDNDEGKYGHCWYVSFKALILVKPESIIVSRLREAAHG